MRIWIVTVGEPLPTDTTGDRPQRSGMLVPRLVERGHDVVWWSSTLDHNHKRHRFDQDTRIRAGDSLEMRLFHGLTYRRNVSLRRLADHRVIARKFARAVVREEPPDVILCSLPTIELSYEATIFARNHGVPILIDVRDLWPDIFLDVLPRWARPAGQLALAPMVRQARAALSGCTGVVGISQGYLDWGLRSAGRCRRHADALFPLGYEPSRPEPAGLEAARASLVARGVDPNRTVCWFVGTFGRTYDLDTVVEAARKLGRELRGPAQIVLSGAGDSLDRLRVQARDLPGVVFTGWLDATEIACMAQMADVGLMAYAAGAPQGLPNKLFEYLSAGIPILSSLRGETAELLAVHGCGHTYPASDADGLADALRAMLGSRRQREDMGRCGARLFDQRYSADAVYRDMAAFLERFAPKMQTAVAA